MVTKLQRLFISKYTYNHSFCKPAPSSIIEQKSESLSGECRKDAVQTCVLSTVYRHVRGLLKSWHGLGSIAKRRALILVKDPYRPYRHTVYTRRDVDLVYHPSGDSTTRHSPKVALETGESRLLQTRTRLPRVGA